jgi:type II secretory pathway component GspD/PulD (secretin)
MKSGQVMVIGGLMKNSSDSTDTGVPFISRAPLVGNLFKSVSKTNTVVETVIFIKATIINGSSTDATDRKVYKELIQDSHPIAF